MGSPNERCAFCVKIQMKDWTHMGPHAVAFRPERPTVLGHLIVAPMIHVRDALINPTITAQTFHYAAALAVQLRIQSCNFITSVGPEADAAVPHLHIHIIPRAPGDGVTLPWTPKPKTASQARKSSDTLT